LRPRFFEIFLTPSVDLRVPANRIQEIVKGERAITPNTALRLARYLGDTAQFWLNLQSRYDLQTAQDELAERIAREVQPGTE
jgi:antitoxin HigA-1